VKNVVMVLATWGEALLVYLDLSMVLARPVCPEYCCEQPVVGSLFAFWHSSD
jgi:hypothetical protein